MSTKYSQLHDHDHLWLVVVGCQTLNQFRMVEIVHQLYLLTSSLSFLGSSAFVELPGAHTSCLFVCQLEHQAKLSPDKKRWIQSYFASKPKVSQFLGTFHLLFIYHTHWWSRTCIRVHFLVFQFGTVSLHVWPLILPLPPLAKSYCFKTNYTI